MLVTVYIPKPLARKYYDFGNNEIDEEVESYAKYYQMNPDKLITDYYEAMWKLAKKYGTEVLNKTNLNLYGCGKVKGVSMSKVATIVITKKLLDKEKEAVLSI